MKKLFLILALLAATLSLASIIWFSVSGPVLVEWYQLGSVCEQPLIILNPLRDRNAENAADDFLENLQGGNLESLYDVVADRERLQHLRMRESDER